MGVYVYGMSDDTRQIYQHQECDVQSTFKCILYVITLITSSTKIETFIDSYFRSRVTFLVILLFITISDDHNLLESHYSHRSISRINLFGMRVAWLQAAHNSP